MQEEIVGFANPGDMLGIDSIVNNNLFNCSAAAINDAVVCKINKRDFIKESEKHPELMLNLMKRLSKKLKQKVTSA